MKCPTKQQQNIPGEGGGWGLMGTWIDCAVTNKFQQHSGTKLIEIGTIASCTLK